MSGKKVKGEELLIRLETGGRTICEGVSSELPYPFKIGRRETCFWPVPKDGVKSDVFVRVTARGATGEQLFTQPFVL